MTLWKAIRLGLAFFLATFGNAGSPGYSLGGPTGMWEAAGLDCYKFKRCSSTAPCAAFVMQMAGTKCPFDNVQSGDKKKKAFTAAVKLIHKAERQ